MRAKFGHHHRLRHTLGSAVALFILTGCQTAGQDDPGNAVPALLDGDITYARQVITGQLRAALGHELALPESAFRHAAEFRPEPPRPSQRIGAHPGNGLLLQPMPLFRLQRQADGHCHMLQVESRRVWPLSDVSCRPADSTR